MKGVFGVFDPLGLMAGADNHVIVWYDDPQEPRGALLIGAEKLRQPTLRHLIVSVKVPLHRLGRCVLVWDIP